MKIHLIAVGVLKAGPEKELLEEYSKRLHCKLKITEIQIRQDKEIKADVYIKYIGANDHIIILDEIGNHFTSIEFAKKISKIAEQKNITFIIGGADGLPETIRQMAHDKIAFGKNTWPHMLVRVMLVEQLYRAQQILSGHPYHKI